MKKPFKDVLLERTTDLEDELIQKEEEAFDKSTKRYQKNKKEFHPKDPENQYKKTPVKNSGFQQKLKAAIKRGNSKDVDWHIFEELLFIQCTKREVCSVLGITSYALDVALLMHYKKPWNEISERYLDVGRASLRRCQFRLAQKNPAMAIWLGKQYLDQREDPIMGSNYKALARELGELRLEPRPGVAGDLELRPLESNVLSNEVLPNINQSGEFLDAELE